jgi:trans-aconitate 2-methyltransferase
VADPVEGTPVEGTPVEGTPEDSNPGDWDPGQYARFAAERRQPFDDLLALCHRVPGGRIVDLGCGPGILTVELHRVLGAGGTLGIDRSPAMVEAARSSFGDVTGVTFLEGDIGAWSDRGVDLVAASASLQWVDGHPALLGRLRAALAAGGQLAFQVPANFSHPSHVLARQVAAEAPFARALSGAVPPDRGRSVLSPTHYAELLHDLGAVEQRVRLEVYGHELATTGEVVEWVKGTLLTPYRERLDGDTYEAFVDRYRWRLLEELGDRRPYFYAFPRILGWARFP